MTKGPTINANQSVPKTRAASQSRPVSTARKALSQPVVAGNKPARSKPTKSRSAEQQTAQGTLDARARRVDLPRRKIPDDVRKALKGKTYRSWSSFRRAVNKAWAKSPTVKGDPFFSASNLKRMRSGLNPKSPNAGRVGRRGSMEYDHKVERRDGGRTYDVRNLNLRTPLSHTKKVERKFNIASGALKPNGKPKI